MSTNPFAAPAAASGIKWETLNGLLLLVEPSSVEAGVKTVHGDTDAVLATVTVIEADGGSETYEDTLIFPKVLQSQLKPKIGEKVLGRLGQGTAKPGQNAPWMLNDPTEEDIKSGVVFLNARTSGQVSAPPPPATAGAGNPPF